jgi:hypothetical protein
LHALFVTSHRSLYLSFFLTRAERPKREPGREAVPKSVRSRTIGGRDLGAEQFFEFLRLPFCFRVEGPNSFKKYLSNILECHHVVREHTSARRPFLSNVLLLFQLVFTGRVGTPQWVVKKWWKIQKKFFPPDPLKFFFEQLQTILGPKKTNSKFLERGQIFNFHRFEACNWDHRVEDENFSER